MVSTDDSPGSPSPVLPRSFAFLEAPRKSRDPRRHARLRRQPGQRLKLCSLQFLSLNFCCCRFPCETTSSAESAGRCCLCPQSLPQAKYIPACPNRASVEKADGCDWAPSHPRGEAGHLPHPHAYEDGRRMCYLGPAEVRLVLAGRCSLRTWDFSSCVGFCCVSSTFAHHQAACQRH